MKVFVSLQAVRETSVICAGKMSLQRAQIILLGDGLAVNVAL